MTTTTMHDVFLSTLRKAFADSGLTLNRLALSAGTPYMSVHAFFSTEKRDDISLVTLAKWCSVLGLELRPTVRKAKATPPTKGRR